MPYALLAALAAEAERAERGSRTLLVAPTRGEGREILRALAREHGGWLGLEVTTARPLALELVSADLAAKSLTLLDEFAEQAFVDELLDEALAAAPDAGALRELAEGVGFRAAVREAVSALRLAGSDARQLTSATFGDRRKQGVLTALLARHRERSKSEHLADTADVLRMAEAGLRKGASLPADRILLVPGLGTRGLAGRFIAALEARGARRLPADRVEGISVPPGFLWNASEAAPPKLDMEIFRAAGITEELREVLRRVMALGLRYDQVEIVTPDPGVYGPALHALAERLGIPVTFAVGLPVERTRAGRAVAAYVRWLEAGFPDAVLRRLLESGDLEPPKAFKDVDGPRLARALRRLRIGWGEERYLPAIASAKRRFLDEGPRPRKDEEAEDAAERHRRTIHELDALAALLKPILDAAPPVPARGDPRVVTVTPAAIAAGLASFLRMVPGGGSVDDTALEMLGRILDRIEATLLRPTTFSSALTIVAEHLAIRIPAPRAEGRAPWGSAGGHLHLTDVEHGGWTARAAAFVVGLDSGRFPGQGSQDPVLLDHEREALARHDLPGSADRLDERRFRMAALLARLRGKVTLSYSAWEPSEGRTLTPSSLLLDAFRAGAGGASAGYRTLEKHLGNPISRLPPAAERLDREDVWLGALARGGHLLAGEEAVRAAFPLLDAGLSARDARDGAPSAYHGLVTPRPELDPRDREDAPLSASRLEALGVCALRYFYASVLRVRPPDDPAFDPERWLDPLRRGSLFHKVYERLIDEALATGMDFEAPAFEDAGLRILREEADAMRREVPPPSESVWQREMAGLVAEMGSFVGMIREDAPSVVESELAFSTPIGLPSGRVLWLRGAIDRVDRLKSGELRVVDYKTGSNRNYGSKAVFRGGRRLQHALYSAAVEAVLKKAVDRAEYHFPTRKGENYVAAYHRAQLGGGLDLVEQLLDLAAQGRFLPTDEPEDCFFCDFKSICRVTKDRWGKIDAPTAEWGKARYGEDVYDLVRAVRDVP